MAYVKDLSLNHTLPFLELDSYYVGFAYVIL